MKFTHKVVEFVLDLFAIVARNIFKYLGSFPATCVLISVLHNKKF